MKHYLKARFIWQFMGIVTVLVLLLFLHVGGDAMIRFIILLGYFALTLYLQLSGKLSHYINLHYSYLVYISMLLSLLLALVQFYIWIKKINSHSHLESRPS